MTRKSGNNVVPEQADFDVRCDKSLSGKHVPTTKETMSEGKHIKYKVCKECEHTLR